MESICDLIDMFFNDLIRNYPESTRFVLYRMYYAGENIFPKENLIEEGAFASWSLSLLSDGSIRYNMNVDSKLTDCPVVLRWQKIHEIAGHLGQVHQRIEQVGLTTWLGEKEEFFVFSEHSVAFAEKAFLDALPDRVITRDLANIQDTSCRAGMLREVSFRTGLTVEDYTALKHYGGFQPTYDPAKVFIREDIKAWATTQAVSRDQMYR